MTNVNANAIQRPKCLKVARELLTAGKSVAVGAFYYFHPRILPRIHPRILLQTKKLIGTQTTQTPTRRHDPTGSLSPKNFPSLFVAFSSCLPRNYVDIITLFAPRIKN